MIDGRQFNILDDDGRLLCPVCGFPGFASSPAYDERGGVIGTAICPCCFWEPGFDDNPAASKTAMETILQSVTSYRAAWHAIAEWKGNSLERPSGWDSEQQLANLMKLAPHLK